MANLISISRAQQTKALENVDPVLLGDLIAAASDAIEKYCDRVFTSAAYIEKRNGNGLAEITVHNPPIVSLTQVIITDSAENTETIAATEFRYDADTGRVVFKPTNSSTYILFPIGQLNIQIDYTGGYATIPASVQEACVEAVKTLHGQTNKKASGIKSFKMGEYSETRSDVMQSISENKTIINLLSGYKRYSIFW